MAVSVQSSGSQACTLDTEHTLATITTAGTYQLMLDLSNLVIGDILVARLKCKAFSAQGSVILFEQFFSGPPGNEKLALSPPIPAPIELVATIEQTDGTGRTVPWAVYAY